MVGHLFERLRLNQWKLRIDLTQSRACGSDERNRFAHRAHHVAKKCGRTLVIRRVDDSGGRRSDINGCSIRCHAHNLKKGGLRAVGETDAFADGILPRQVSLNEGAAHDNDAGSVLGIASSKKAAIDQRDLQ